MYADIKGTLERLRRSYRWFTHNGKPLRYHEVKALLEYGLSKGYTSTSQLTDPEIDAILEKMRGIP